MDPLSFHINAFREQALRHDWLPLLREARQLMQPIGTSQNDEWLLVRSLATAHVRRQPEQEALRQLHGVNSHAETVWRDYYFAHRPRIDVRVSELLQRLQAHMSVSPSLPSAAEERTMLPSARPACATGYLNNPSALLDHAAPLDPAFGSNSLPTPISPHLTLASPYRRPASCKERLAWVSEADKGYIVRKLQEALERDESFNVTELARSIAASAEASHRPMDTWRKIMYRHPEARAILAKRKNCVFLRADEDVGAWTSGAEDSDDAEEPGRMRASRRSRRPSCRKRLVPSKQVEAYSSEDFSNAESPDEGEESDTAERSRGGNQAGKHVNSCGYTDSERRGKHNGLYTLGDMKALASLLLEHPELETLPEHPLGELIEEQLGIRTASAWRKAFSRRKHIIVAFAAQLRAGQDAAVDSSPLKSSNLAPASASSTFPPNKRPRLTMPTA